MAKQGDWGGGGVGMVKGTVKRTANVTKNFTGTVPDSKPAPDEECAKLRFISEPWYTKEPLNPDYKRNPERPLGG